MQKMPDTFQLERSGSIELEGTRVASFGGSRYLVPFGVTIRYVDPASGKAFLEVAGRIDERDGRPVLTQVAFDSDDGWDLVWFQKWWKWADLIKLGLKLCQSDGTRAEIDDYIAKMGRRHELTDGYLAVIAARYLELGRGYAPQLAREYVVSARTITSWVVLARERGLLTQPERVGAVGGQLTAKGKRALRTERRREREEQA